MTPRLGPAVRRSSPRIHAGWWPTRGGAQRTDADGAAGCVGDGGRLGPGTAIGSIPRPVCANSESGRPIPGRLRNQGRHSARRARRVRDAWVSVATRRPRGGPEGRWGGTRDLSQERPREAVAGMPTGGWTGPGREGWDGGRRPRSRAVGVADGTSERARAEPRERLTSRRPGSEGSRSPHLGEARRGAGHCGYIRATTRYPSGQKPAALDTHRKPCSRSRCG